MIGSVIDTEKLDLTCKLKPEMPEINRKDTTLLGEMLQASLINKVFISSYAKFGKAVILVSIDQYHKLIDDLPILGKARRYR